ARCRRPSGAATPAAARTTARRTRLGRPLGARRPGPAGALRRGRPALLGLVLLGLVLLGLIAGAPVLLGPTLLRVIGLERSAHLLVERCPIGHQDSSLSAASAVPSAASSIVTPASTSALLSPPTPSGASGAAAASSASSSSSRSGLWATTATESFFLRLTNRTPIVERPVTRKSSLIGLRTTWPWAVIERISSPSSTMKAPTREPRSSLASFIALMPMPPRDWRRYSAIGVRLAYPPSVIVKTYCSFTPGSSPGSVD